MVIAADEQPIIGIGGVTDGRESTAPLGNAGEHQRKIMSRSVSTKAPTSASRRSDEVLKEGCHRLLDPGGDLRESRLGLGPQ
jgi:hypothetical protein